MFTASLSNSDVTHRPLSLGGFAVRGTGAVLLDSRTAGKQMACKAGTPLENARLRVLASQRG